MSSVDKEGVFGVCFYLWLFFFFFNLNAPGQNMTNPLKHVSRNRFQV